MPWKVEENFIVVLGGNTFVNTPNLIMYRGESIFTIERNVDSGYSGISFRIFDETGVKFATIGQNRLFENRKYKGPKSVILEGSVHDYIIKERPSDRVICNIKQKVAAKPAELDVSVSLYMPDGFLFEADPNSINLPMNNQISNCAFSGLGCGISISCQGEPQKPMSVGLGTSLPKEYCRKPFSYK